jgi:hypothetical protein
MYIAAGIIYKFIVRQIPSRFFIYFWFMAVIMQCDVAAFLFVFSLFSLYRSLYFIIIIIDSAHK